MSRPVLYHYWLSSASWRVRWALAIKNLAHDVVVVDIRAGQQTSPEHRARNPMGRVPALSIDGKWLAESVAIIEFLDETHPEPALYPRDPFVRARVRQMVELVNSGVQPLQNLPVMAAHSSDPEAQKKFAATFNERGLKAYEELLAQTERDGLGGQFSVGNTLTAADLFLIPQVASARRFEVDVTPFPRVLAVETAARATPHAEAARPENQPK
jgi:maleylacetoacetate isomerase